MERLTDKLRGLCLSCELSIDDECDHLDHNEFCENAKRYDRLADIEDILGDDYDLDRLRELVEADKDGRCVGLPCKLHDKVFFIENGEVKETEVTSFHQWTSGHWKMQTNTDKMGKHWTGYEVDFDGIGKTVFLTGEEAMAAMKGEKNG